MTEQRKKYLDILGLLDYDIDDNIDSGSLERVVFDPKTMITLMVIAFEKPFSIKKLVQLGTDIASYMTKNIKHNPQIKVEFIFKNKFIDEKHLKEYYEYFVENACNDRARCNALKKFIYIITDNKITYSVASDDEKKIVEELFKIIIPQMQDFGLDFVTINIDKNPLVSPIEEEIKISVNTSLNQARRDMRSQEIKEVDNKTEKRKTSTLGNRSKSRLTETPTPLKKLPTSEFELTDYTNKNFNDIFVVEGDVIEAQIKELKGGYKIYEATITDGSSSILLKTFINLTDPYYEKFYLEKCMVGFTVIVVGKMTYDKYSRDLVINIKEITSRPTKKQEFNVEELGEPRVELHTHTKMSAQDAVLDISAYVDRAIKYGYKALAVTDHYNVQAFPEFYKKATENNIKPIFGLEGRFVDEKKFKIALTTEDIDLRQATYVVYDLETTGFSATYNEIIEIAACKVKNGMIIEEFSEYVKPKKGIPKLITRLTSITDDDVRSAGAIEEVLPKFWDFINGAILVAHNAIFDNSHLYGNLQRLGLEFSALPTIDTLQFARIYYGDKLKKFSLGYVAKLFGVDLEQHHRAIYDAKATTEIFLKMLKGLFDSKIFNYNQINAMINPEEAFKHAIPTHITLLAKNHHGLISLNKIVSESHTKTFYREPRILRSFLESHRDGLLVGSSCYRGEVFDTALNKSYEDLLEVVSFYDYLEVQPVEGYCHLIESSDGVITVEILQEVIKKIIKAGEAKGVIVVATGDVHFLEPNDDILRKMLVKMPLVGGGLHDLKDVEKMPEQYFKDTQTMLKEFSFLGDDVAHQIVVKNTNYISDKIEEFNIFPEKMFAPTDDFLAEKGIPSAKQGVIDLTYKNAYAKYGNPLSQYIQDRLDKELKSIIDNNYATVYYISYLLVKHSKDDGYVVGSRGSVGSSLVATFMEITEVNPLPPHYVCPKCHFNAFKLNSEEKKIYHQHQEAAKFSEVLQNSGTGYDLPEKLCPVCGTKLEGDGCDIPFETFLGFKGDKVPDIDLNFSSDYQSKAHDFCREVFGEEYTFRAGTISAMQDNTAYGYVKGHNEREGKPMRYSDIKLLVAGLCGVKRSTGQHPGGIVVVPRGMDINEITPIQYPADDPTKNWYTTHHGYHDFERNLLKLDILGHDDPTMIRHLMNFVNDDPSNFPFKTVEEIPLSDHGVLNLFSSVEALGVTPAQVKMDMGTTGLPEFGTSLAKAMLKDIRPRTVSDLIKISGLSHGRNVWNGNSKDYFFGMKEGVSAIPFNDLIGCRDDIMLYLLEKGLPAFFAFSVMEKVRRGNGVSPAEEKEMMKYNVPKWYIDSCKSIKYMFPKAHAAAYTIMALRIAWFKLYRPIHYYAGYFSRRTSAFDIETMVAGYDAIFQKVKDIEERINTKQEVSNKEIDVYDTLLLALEMTARGFNFKQIDLIKSDWRDFLIEENSLVIPFIAMDSLGENTAKSIVDAREEASFTSIKDLSRRTKLSNTLIERFSRLGIVDNFPIDDQLEIFNI
ncbi:MAG TPA: PolC-type DNA polymerase III [Bacilli bacterium]|nr:PolC-type DNA polymerase III [Bacilli bacterium]